jgi:ABC-type antimicrobial peptide transport system permease subunit
MRITLLGGACGLVLAALSTRFLAGMLFGVSRFDLLTLAGVVGFLLLVAASACLIPSLRASRTDPMRVLREQ